MLLLAIFGGVLQTRVDTGIQSFVPTGDPAYHALQERDRVFGADPLIVELEGKDSTGLLLDSVQLPLLLSLEGRLASLPDIAVVYGPATMLNQTAKGLQDLLARISGERDALRAGVIDLALKKGASKKAAHRAARLALVGFDRRYGALITKALPVGLPTLRNARFVGEVLFNDRGDPKQQWKLLVPDTRRATVLVRPREGLSQSQTAQLVASVRDVATESGLSLRRVTVTGVPVLTSDLAAEAKKELPRLAILALGAVALAFWILPWSRHRRSRLRPLVSALIGSAATIGAFSWAGQSLSLGVITFLPILLGIGSDFPLYLSQPIPRRTVLVAAGAAMVGFLTLGLSHLPFVREMGIALSLGITFTVGAALLLSQIFPVVEPAAEHATAPPKDRPSRPRWAGPVAALGLVLAAVGWAMLPTLRIETSPQQLAQGLPSLAAANRIGNELGFAGEIDVLLKGKSVLSPDAIAWAREAESKIVRNHGDRLQPVLTVGRLLEFLGDNATHGQAKAAVDLLPAYLLQSVVAPDQTLGALVLGVRLEDIAEQEELFKEVALSLPEPPKGYESQLVGLPVVAVRSVELVAGDRFFLNFIGIGAAGLVLALGLRHRGDALRALIAVALSAGWVFGLVWLSVGTLSPLTVAVGALVTVTGCEFTVMLAYASRHGAQWVHRSVATAATAGVLGYVVLAASGLHLVREFGVLLAAAVGGSFVAAHLVVTLFPPAAEVPEQARTAALTREEVAL